VTGILVFSAILITSGTQVFRVARGNPVDILRIE